ncbi:hypothetical protein BDV39DRAFT_165929 [Aspergillus sergii]|uniref:Uncharacterized protein n=1 Tax=Aspergillus sergii TaxID=1034303 RepID=A0A5N6XKT8_9EURO|nr:hypothetical protein BDV39DRAFT_165929 [Aspergillus sergii]
MYPGYYCLFVLYYRVVEFPHAMVVMCLFNFFFCFPFCWCSLFVTSITLELEGENHMTLLRSKFSLAGAIDLLGPASD